MKSPRARWAPGRDGGGFGTGGWRGPQTAGIATRRAMDKPSERHRIERTALGERHDSRCRGSGFDAFCRCCANCRGRLPQLPESGSVGQRGIPRTPDTTRTARAARRCVDSSIGRAVRAWRQRLLRRQHRPHEAAKLLVASAKYASRRMTIIRSWTPARSRSGEPRKSLSRRAVGELERMLCAPLPAARLHRSDGRWPRLMPPRAQIHFTSNKDSMLLERNARIPYSERDGDTTAISASK